MGIWQSTQRGSEEEVDISTASQYRYPPKTGNFFSVHFIMGGEKFDSPQPESFLFGENSDLNFLGPKPVPFPYPPPQANEPTKTLKALINIRRDSLHFTRVKTEDGKDDPGKYNIVFTFDSDVKTSITIYYLATEEMTGQSVMYTPNHEELSSPTYMYRKGASQIFSQTDHVFQPGLYENEGLDNVTGEMLPVVIHCQAEEGDEPRQSHVTIGVIEKHSDGIYALKTLKQKLFVDGLCYLIQEIYGVERKGCDEMIEDEMDDTGAECVVCMCDSRDTLILPCRHLCLCNACADSLRYQANNCPICRAPFRALLQIRALQKIGHSATHPALAAEAQTEGVPPGYELVSLVEALNGPFAPPPPPAAAVTLSEADRDAAGKKKKSKRRGSKEPHASKDGKRSGGGSEKGLSPPPVEEVDTSTPLPPPPATPPPPTCDAGAGSMQLAAAEDVTIIDEKGHRGSVSSGRSIRKTKVLGDEVNKIKLEVASEVSLRSDLTSRTGTTCTLGDSDLVEQELARIEDIAEIDGSIESVYISGKNQDKQVIQEEDEQKEPTTEDELLREEKLTDCTYDPSMSDVLYDQNMYRPDYSAGSDLDEDQEEDPEDDDPDDEAVEVVSLRNSKEERPISTPGTPRSSSSIRSSQESAASSVNSTNQLLDKHEDLSEATAAVAVAGGGQAKKREKKRRGKSSIAPQPEEEC